VRANAYKPFVITSQSWISSSGLYLGRRSAFCAAGVNDGTCAFGVPAVGALGNVGINTLRAPSFFNLTCPSERNSGYGETVR